MCAPRLPGYRRLRLSIHLANVPQALELRWSDLDPILLAPCGFAVFSSTSNSSAAQLHPFLVNSCLVSLVPSRCLDMSHTVREVVLLFYHGPRQLKQSISHKCSLQSRSRRSNAADACQTAAISPLSLLKNCDEATNHELGRCGGMSHALHNGWAASLHTALFLRSSYVQIFPSKSRSVRSIMLQAGLVGSCGP